MRDYYESTPPPKQPPPFLTVMSNYRKLYKAQHSLSLDFIFLITAQRSHGLHIDALTALGGGILLIFFYEEVLFVH